MIMNTFFVLKTTVDILVGVLFASSGADVLSMEAAAAEDDEDEDDTKPLAMVTERQHPPTTWMKPPL